MAEIMTKEQVFSRLLNNESIQCRTIGDLNFQNYVFEMPVNFHFAEFRGQTNFSRAVFKKKAFFTDVIFEENANFSGCTFEEGAYFSRSHFSKDADFFGCHFSDIVHFWNSRIQGNASFYHISVTRSQGKPDGFDGQANFSWTRFAGKTEFTFAKFYWPAYFWRTQFYKDALLDLCEFHDKVLFSGKQNEVLFSRFDLIRPEVVNALEHKGFFRSEHEYYRTYKNERFSEFVLFNNVLSLQNLENKLKSFNDIDIDISEKEIIKKEWLQGAKKMFADKTLVSFRGTTFHKFPETEFLYIDLEEINLDGAINGSKEDKKTFSKIIKSKSHDVFISHATEDKEEIVTPLVSKLKEIGVSVWHDKGQIQPGDSLIDKIDEGIQNSRNGIVVLSKHFFAKNWTQYELDQLTSQGDKEGKLIIPLWHKVNESDVSKLSKKLADKLAFDTAKYNIDELAEKIAAQIMR